MTINVHISVENPAEYFATLNALLAGVPGTKPSETSAAAVAAAKTGEGKKAENKKTEPAASKPSETPAAAAPAASEKAYTLADIAEIVPKCAAKDRTRTVELLGKYGAKKGGELKPADYAAFIADANKFLAE